MKFEASSVEPSPERPQGVRYSLTLHNRHNRRILGFDNSHAVQKVFDHWHRNETDTGRPYRYVNAGKLIEDFWKEVEKVLSRVEEEVT